MATRFTAKIYTQRAQARLRKFERAIEDAGKQTVQDLVNVGKEHARILVPKGSTGWLYKTIKGKVIGGNKPQGQVYLEPQILPDNQRLFPNSTKYPQFNLAKWMHLTKGKFRTKNPFGMPGKQHIKTGDPQFMYTTAKILNSRKKVIATGNFNKIQAKVK